MFLALWLGCRPERGPIPIETAVETDSSSESGTTPTGTDSPPETTPDSPVLTVDGGFGGGTYAIGAPVQVWADVDPQTEVVAGWTGDIGLLENSLEWNAAGSMPDHSAQLAPTVAVVPLPLERRTYSLEGRSRDVLVVETAGARGAVLFFHGASYSIDELRDNAGMTVAMQLVRGGYTVVAVQSESEAASGTGGWSSVLSLATNTDLRNVSAVIDALHADGTIAPGTPLAAWGMSSGGFFAHAVGGVGLVDAVVAYCAAGNPDANLATSAATAWYMAGNDTTFPTGAADAATFQGLLAARGIATDRYVHPPTALYDQRFERVAGIDAVQSLEIASALRASGAVDSHDGWTSAGSAVTAGLSVPGLSAAQLTAVKAEIEIMAADHELYDDVAARMVGFLDANLAL